MTFPSVPPVEIGSLNAFSPNETHFIGSSSGIFFANTVHRAFAKSKHNLYGAITEDSPDDRFSVDECITGDEIPGASQSLNGRRPTSSSNSGHITAPNAYGLSDPGLGSPPSRNQARHLVMEYFRLWHPLFPFLHGPSFLQEIEKFYEAELEGRVVDPDAYRSRLCRAITFQCIFNISALDNPSVLPPESKIESASGLLSLLGSIVKKNDIQCFETLLAMELYLIATMSLRAASTVGGLLLRTIFHSGLHRCPFRYPQLSQHDCDIRKRMFWSAYVADRYLSQALGYPLGIQDSDIDVCIPGSVERHKHVSRSRASHIVLDAEREVSLHLPTNAPIAAHAVLVDDSGDSSGPGHEASQSTNGEEKTISLQHGEETFASYIEYGKFTGQIVELFHKSIHNRSVDLDKILLLTSEVNAWWNALPQYLQDQHPWGQPTQTQAIVTRNTIIGSYFSILHQEMILLINRPFLSLIPTKSEFKSSLQTCIGASRSIIATLQQLSNMQYPSYPGILSGTWMSGLVLAFGCALKSYPFKKGSGEIRTCLELLERMTKTSTSAKHCHAVLSILLDDLQAKFDKDTRRTSEHPNDDAHSFSLGSLPSDNWKESEMASGEDQQPRKRQRINTEGAVRVTADDNAPLSLVDEPAPATGMEPLSNDPIGTPGRTFEDPQWIQDPTLWDGIDRDIFGNLSWEVLFQNDSGTNWAGMGGI